MKTKTHSVIEIFYKGSSVLCNKAFRKKFEAQPYSSTRWFFINLNQTRSSLCIKHQTCWFKCPPKWRLTKQNINEQPAPVITKNRLHISSYSTTGKYKTLSSFSPRLLSTNRFTPLCTFFLWTATEYLATILESVSLPPPFSRPLLSRLKFLFIF